MAVRWTGSLSWANAADALEKGVRLAHGQCWIERRDIARLEPKLQAIPDWAVYTSTDGGVEPVWLTEAASAETQRWNRQFFPVRTRADMRAYCRHNFTPAERAETATLTKCGASSAPARPEPRRDNNRTSCYNYLHAGN